VCPPQESGGIGSGGAELPGYPVHGLGELDIQLGDTAGIMGRQNQPESSVSAAFRASTVSRSNMIASPFHVSFTLTPNAARGIHAQNKAARRVQWPPDDAGNHDADVTSVRQEIC
jgi:hypothetical protein